VYIGTQLWFERGFKMLRALIFLALSIPVFADSIPAPVTNLPMTGMAVSGFFNSPTNYDLNVTNVQGYALCSGICVSLEMEKGVTTGSSFPNYGWIYNFTPGQSAMFGHLGKVSLVDDELTAIFTGKEGIVSGGVWSWYTVQGTYSDYMPALLKYPSLVGAGGIVLSRETYIGISPVPEPPAFILLATGIILLEGCRRGLKHPEHR
jgi:hypothetical protein